jgi:hypothetical protein
MADGQTQEANQTTDLLPEIDFHDYFGALDVDRYNTDSEINFRDPAKKRKRDYKVYPLTPIDAQEHTSDNLKQPANKATRRKNHAPQRVITENDHQAVMHHEAREHADDESSLMDSALNEQYTQLQNHMNPETNLDSQRDDPSFAAIIDHPQTGAPPNDRALAQRILCQTDDFYIEDNQLWHLARLRGKRVEKLALRFQQICIPRKFRMKIMESIHNISHFSFLKCYLTARQRFYWPAMASEMVK